MPDLKLRPQARWIARTMARRAKITEEEAESAILQLIAHGHIKLLPDADPNGADAFIIVVRNGNDDQD